MQNKAKPQNQLDEYLKKYDWLWENNTPITVARQKVK